MRKIEKKGPEAMKPLLRHSIGQHDPKTVVRSNFSPEMAEISAPQFFGRTRLTQLYLYREKSQKWIIF